MDRFPFIRFTPTSHTERTNVRLTYVPVSVCLFLHFSLDHHWFHFMTCTSTVQDISVTVWFKFHSTVTQGVWKRNTMMRVPFHLRFHQDTACCHSPLLLYTVCVLSLWEDELYTVCESVNCIAVYMPIARECWASGVCKWQFSLTVVVLLVNARDS